MKLSNYLWESEHELWSLKKIHCVYSMNIEHSIPKPQCTYLKQDLFILIYKILAPLAFSNALYFLKYIIRRLLIKSCWLWWKLLLLQIKKIMLLGTAEIR